MNKFPVALLFFVMVSSTVLAQTDCTLRVDKDSIKVYTCNTDTSKYKSIRAEFVLNTSYEELEKFLRNIDHYTEWQYNTTEARLLKKVSDTKIIYYTKIDVPWPAADRDIVVDFEFIRSGRQYIIRSKALKGMLPGKESTVRITSSRAQWTITEKNKNRLEIKYVLQIDPAGAVPTWLVNLVCANAPYQSFKKLKVELEK